MDWFWILAFVGLMFVMHRFGMGCCGGHAHGKQPESAVRRNAESPPREADAGVGERKV